MSWSSAPAGRLGRRVSVETVEGDVTDVAAVRRVSQSADVLVVTVGGPDKSLYLDAARTLVAAAQEIGERAPRSRAPCSRPR